MGPKLKVIVVGAGLGGLAAALALALKGHNVTVLEASAQVGEVGAGIQVTPNLARLLHQWELTEALGRHGVRPDWVRQVRWKDGKELTRFSLNLDGRMQKTFGVEYSHIHRVDLHRMLLAKAEELGARMITRRTVTEYQCLKRDALSMNGGTCRHEDSITLEGGETMVADLIIAADGSKSTLSEFVTGTKSVPTATGDSAYRALLSRDKLQRPEFESLLLDRGSVVWLGPGAHVVGYYVRNREFYNLVVLVPTQDTEEQEESWKLPGDVNKMRVFFKDWDPRLRAMLDMVEESYLWNLRDRDALNRWLHPQGNLVLLGDAAHPMLPYVAQGAASAIEDAAVLAECVDFVTQERPLRKTLDIYQQLRIPRASAMCREARRNRTYFHLPDGPEQEKRDATLASQSDAEETPNILDNPRILQQMYGHDAVSAVRREFGGDANCLVKTH